MTAPNIKYFSYLYVMDKPSKLILIEGAKNVGKSYLLANSGFKSYKFPFSRYFDEFLSGNTDNVGTGDGATYHFSTSFDVSIHSLANGGLINGPLLVDRGFLSNLVLGRVQNRITDETAYKYLRFLHGQNYLSNNVRVIYISKFDHSKRDEAKDQWEYLNNETVHRKYHDYMTWMHQEFGFHCEGFVNEFDAASVEKFKTLISKI